MKKIIDCIVVYSKALALTIYYKFYKVKKSLPKLRDNKNRIIVSLTSYKERLPFVIFTIKTIFNQSVKPNIVILWLYEDCKELKLPSELIEMTQYGLIIKYCSVDMKPHKKYYYAFKEYPDDYIITIDDDCFYSRKMIECLMKAFQKNNVVTAGRVSKIATNEMGVTASYNKWARARVTQYECPSMLNFAKGVGGVLYPPRSMKLDILLDTDAIMKFCVYADDIWLKYVQLISEIPVQAAKCKKPVTIPHSQGFGSLFRRNVIENGNDVVISELSKYFGMDLYKSCKEYNEKHGL